MKTIPLSWILSPLQGERDYKWFTLVELLVVIVILAILWTVSFMYWQTYVKDTRDAVRITDMWSAEKALRLYAIKNDNQFPTPDNSVEVSYSWAEVWTQWVFWETVFKAVWLMNKEILDPDTLERYPYSVSNQRNEFEIWSIVEAWTLQTNKIINQVYAWNTVVPAIIKWNYNWIMLKASTGSTEYIFALPSIISSDLWTPTINYIINNKKLVYNWYWNLPASYKNSRFKTDWWWALNLLNADKFVVFSWSLEDLKTNETKQLELIANLQEAYSWTVIKEKNKIKEILGVDSVNNEESAKYLVQTLMKNNIDPKFKVTAEKISEPTTCITQLTETEANTLNTFFNWSWYNWDLDYWCGLTSISATTKWLNWSLPNVLFKLYNLEFLDLGRNNITWNIPEAIWNLTNLKMLSFWNNNLTWNIPSSIWNLTNLMALTLDKNNLTWDIPNTIWNLNNTVFISLNDNNLTWNIPDIIWNLTNLEYLFLNNNTGSFWNLEYNFDRNSSNRTEWNITIGWNGTNVIITVN